MAANTPSKFGPKDPQNNNVKLPGNNDGVASVIGAALFGNSGIQNSDKLASEGKKQGSIVDNINELVIGSKKAFEMDSKLHETTIELKTAVTQSSESLKSITQFQESNNKLLQALALITAHELDIVNQNIISGKESLIKINNDGFDSLSNSNDKISKSIDSVHKSLKDILTNSTTKIEDSIALGCKNLTDSLNVLHKTPNTNDEIGKSIASVQQSVKDTLNSSTNKIEGSIVSGNESLTSTFSNGFVSLSNSNNEINTSIKSVQQSVKDILTNSTGKIDEHIVSGYESLTSTFSNGFVSLSNSNDKISTRIDSVRKSLKDTLKISTNKLLNINDEIKTSIDITHDTLNNTNNKLNELFDNLVGDTKGVLNQIKSWIGSSNDYLKNIDNITSNQKPVDLAAIINAIESIKTDFNNTFANKPYEISIPEIIKTQIDNVVAGTTKIFDGLNNILTEIRKTQDRGATGDDSDAVKGIIDIIINGADKDVIESLKALSEVKITDDSLLSVEQIENFKKYFERLNEVFVLTSTLGSSAKDSLKVNKTINNAIQKHIELKESLNGSFVVTNEDTANIEAFKIYFEKLDDLFKTQVAVAKNAENAVKANKETQKAIKSSHKTAIDANNNIDDIKEGTISLSDLGNFLFKAGITLMIGALFMMIPGILEKCLMFTAALSIFITGIILPLQLISLINKNSDEYLTSIGTLKSLIVSCGFLMMLGSFFMMIPGIMKHALMFGVTLSLFITSLIIPFAIIGAINSGKAFEGINNVKSLVMTAAVAMLLGAFVMSLGGGKYVKSALQFGIVLGTFILLLLLPITLYATLVKDGVKGLHEINKLVVTATIVMMIGALFVMLGGGKFIKNALVFGILLSVFIGLILLPITIYNMLVFRANKTLNNITKLVVVCTIIMMVGALFTMNSTLVVHALAFGFLLATFMALVLSPIIMFSFLGKRAMKSLRDFTVMILVCTIIMMVGAYFIQDWKRVVFALAFTLLLAAFISSVMLAIGFFSKKYPEAMKDMGMFALVIGVAGGVLMLGALLMSKYGWEALAFAALLSAFIFLTMKAIDIGATNTKRIGAGAFAFKQIGIAIGFISVAIGLLAVIGAEYGWGNVILGAGTLLACTFVLMKMFGVLSKNIPNISKGTIGASMIGVGLILLSVAIGTMAIIGKTFGWDNVLIGATTLLAVSGIFVGLYCILGNAKPIVDQGSMVMLAIAGSIGIMAIAIGIIAFIGDTYGWGAVLGGVVTLGAIAFGFSMLYSALMGAAAPVAAGAIVMIAIAGSLLIISAAIGLVAFIGDTYGWGAVLGGVVTLGAIAFGFSMLYSALMAAAAPVAAGAIVMIAIGSSLLIISAAIGLVAFIGDTYGWGAVLGGVLTLGAIAFGFSMLYSALMAAATPVAAGAVVLLAIAGSLGLLTLVIWGIAAIIDKYGEDSITNAPWVLAEFFGTMVIAFIAVAAAGVSAIPAIVGLALMTPAVTMLSSILVKMGVAIKHFREGVEGFDVSVIGKTIEQFIDAAPDFSLKAYLSTKLSLWRVKSLAYTMSDVTSIIAAAVQSIASLAIPTKWNEDGEPIKFRQLTENDFVAAGNSIRSIMITLSDAIITTYTKYPALFGKDAEYILYKVSSLALAQSFILHVLCSGIQSYAQLLIPTKWNKEGEPVKFRPMTTVDFENAAKGIATVMTTIGQAINETYVKFPNLFGIESEWILNRVRALALSQSFILHVLSSGIKSYSQLMIPTKWNKDGVATNYREMTSKDFTSAAQNIAAVLQTMSYAIMSIWNGEEYNVKVGGETVKIGGAGKGLGFYTFLIPHIIDSLMPMGDLIASIAGGMASYAKLMIPTDWDRKGRPIKFQHMGAGELLDAGNNIAMIITSLAEAVQKGYDKLKPNGVWSTLFGPSPEEKIKALLPLGELISSLAEGLANYAALQIPTRWDKKGRIVGYKTMGKEDFKSAAQNIADIILTLGSAIAISYDGGTITFSDGSGWTIGTGLKDIVKIDELKILIESYTAMGDMISNIASGLADYSKLQIPIGWNNKGKATRYRTMEKSDFKSAAQNIADIILTLGAAISRSWDGGKVVFSDGSSWTIGRGLKELVDPEELKMLIESYSEMGDMISNIASGVQAYANLSVPRYGKGGKIVGATPMKAEDMAKAGINIVKVLMGVLIGDSDPSKVETKNIKSGVIGAYNLLNELNIDDDIEEIIESLGGTGDLISNIATGLAAYADLKIATRWDKDGKPVKYRQLKDKDFENAANNIATVLAITTKSIIWAWEGGELKIGNKIYTGEGIADTFDDAALFGDITEQIGKIGNLLSSIAEGIGKFAALQIPNKWNDQGNPIGYLKLTDNDFVKASQNIAKVMTTMFDSLIKVVNENPDYFEKDADIAFKDVIESVIGIGNLIKNIADGINTFAKGGIPIYDKEGKIVGYDKLTEPIITDMNKNIGLIMTALTQSVIDAGIKIDEQSSSEEFNSAIDNVSKIGSLVKNIAEGIQAWAEMKMPIGWNNDGSAKGYRKLKPEDITDAKTNIVHIVKTLCEAMIEAANTGLSNGVRLADFADSDVIPNILAVTSDITDVIKNLTDIVKNIGEMKIPTGYNSDGSAKGYEKLDEGHINSFAATMQKLLTIIPQTIDKVYTENSTLFGTEFTTKTNEIYNVIGNIDSLVSGLMSLIKTFSDNGDDLQKFISFTSSLTAPTAPEGKRTKLPTVKIIADTYVIFDDLCELATLLNGKTKTLPDTSAFTSWYTFLGNMSTLVNDLVYSVIEPISENIESIEKIFNVAKPTGTTTGTYTIGIFSKLDTIYSDIAKLGVIYGNEDTIKSFTSFNSNTETISNTLYNFSDILTTLVEQVVYNLIDNKSDIDIITSTKSGDANIKLAAFESLYNIVSDIDYILKSMSAFTEADTNAMLNNITKFGNVFDALVINVVNKLVANKQYIDTVLENVNVDSTELKLKPIEDLSTIINDVNTLIDKLSSGDIITGLLKAFSFDTFSTNVTNFKNIFNTILSDVVLPIVRYNTQLTKFIQLKGASKGASTVKNQLYECAIFNDIYTIVNDVSTFNEKIRDLDYLKLKEADIIVKTAKDLYNVISNLVNYIVDPANTYHEKISLLYKDSVRPKDETVFNTGVISDIYGVIKDVNDLVKLVNTSVNEDISTFGEGLTVLGNGLMCVIKALNEYTYNEGFAKGTEQIDKFIKNTVNQIDVEKIDRLISLTTSLNNLADKTTNLDELTKAIAEDLTTSLEELTQRMDESKQVIQLSEQIQQKRYQIITKVISEMRGIMNQPIEVIISVKDQETNNNGSQTPSEQTKQQSTTTGTDDATTKQIGKDGTNPTNPASSANTQKQTNKQSNNTQRSGTPSNTSSERTLNDLKNRLETVEADVANLKSNTRTGLTQ